MRKKFVLVILLLAIATVVADEPIYGEIFQTSHNLLLHPDSVRADEHKCVKEVPSLFYQTAKNEPIRGNGSTIYLQRIEVCCEGFIRSETDWYKCVPDCSRVSANNCLNGFCRRPNVCICFDEFVPNDRGECVHTCPISCQNGRCYLNGTCECLPGYALDPATRQFCRPICPQSCGNHQECVAPGRCACIDGYRMTASHGCQPVCTPDCGYGKCVGPNRCECFSGYMKRPRRNVCEAECYIKCENGFCESRYKCQCRDGYKYDSNTTSCLPDCGDECENGVCVEPGLCRCFDGYEMEGSSCRPICMGGCGTYGKCIEPTVCGCGVTNQHCLNGVCDPKGRCRCSKGLTRFIDKCVNPGHLDYLVSSYAQREYYNTHLKEEHNNLIGRMFQFFT